MSGEVSVEVVVPDDTFSTYSLQVKQIQQVESLKHLHHERFQFLGGGYLKGDEMQSHLVLEEQPMEFAMKTRAAFDQRMSVRWQKENDVYQAPHFNALLALSAFAGLTDVWEWYVSDIGDRSVATQNKGYVVFYGDVVPSGLLPLPMVQMDNAVYLAGVDVWMVFPVGSQEGVPYAMNYGVLAHEFHHRIFFQSVWAAHAFKRWKSILSADAKISDAEQRSLNLLRALDEGLADINAIGYTRNLHFMNPSFLSTHLDGMTAALLNDESHRRDLESDFIDQATYDNIGDDSLEHHLVDGCGVADNFENSSDLLSGKVWSPYCLGSVIARVLWDGAYRDFDILRTVILPNINKALPLLGETLARGSNFDLDVFFEILIELLPEDFDRSALCEHIADKFASLHETGRVPSCSSLVE